MKLTLLFLLISINIFSKSIAEKLNTNLFNKSNKKISFDYLESLELLQHNYTPLLISKYNYIGNIELNGYQFQKIDTFQTANEKLSSKTYLDDKTILHLAYRKDKLTNLDSNDFFQEKIDISRYTPYYLYNYLKNNYNFQTIDNKEYTLLRTDFNNNKIEFKINKSSMLIEEIIGVRYNDYFGNDSTKFKYLNYDANYNFPKKIIISKFNGILNDTITISNLKYIDEIKPFTNTPKDYSIGDVEDNHEKISRTIINSKISFINFKIAQTRSLIVEFEKYILVAEAPLKSENGKILLDTLQKIYPNKSVKYFTFGHHHPHYTGGIRPFIDNETEIITIKDDVDYLTLLSVNDHSLEPDGLLQSKKKLKTNIFEDSLKINDNNTEMIIYHIGNLSHHTADYCIYYFPNEKIIVEDDLVFINKDESKWRKPSAREQAILKFINDKNIDVKKIFQTWPINSKIFSVDINYVDYKRYCKIE